MKLYRLITGPDDEKFCLRICEALNRGWELHGSPTLTHDGNHIVAGQALVKEVEGAFSKGVDLRDA